jgi:excisionase family DNA binding protein
MRKPPPPKQRGKCTGKRRFNGTALDVQEAACFIGTTEKTIRSWVKRSLIPYHRAGKRILFVRAEVENFLTNLPGCSMKDALANVAALNWGER